MIAASTQFLGGHFLHLILLGGWTLFAVVLTVALDRARGRNLDGRDGREDGPAAGDPFPPSQRVNMATWPPRRPPEEYKGTRRRARHPVTTGIAEERTAPVVLAALLGLGASGIHAAVCGEHFREWVVYGVFFVVASLAQASWAVVVLARPTRRLLIVGAVGNSAVILLFVMSRVIGIPFGPEAFKPEALEPLGVAATLCEMAGVVVAYYAARRFGRAGDRQSDTTTAVGTEALLRVSSAN